MISSVLAYWGQEKAGAINVVGLSFLERVENAILSYMTYLKKMVWPTDLAVLYPVSINFSLFNSIICLITILVVTAFVLRKGREKQFLIVGWFWYLLTLLPVIGIIHLGHQAYADRYTYFPLIGIFIVISWTVSLLLERFRSFRTAIFVFICFILILLTTATRLQVSFWKNSETLMDHAISVNRDNYMAHYYLGDYLIGKGNLDQGINHLNETIRLKPLFYYPRLDLIKIYRQQNNIESAVTQLREMTKIIPQNSDVYNKVGTLFFSLNLKEDAMEYFKRSLDINPSNDMAHENIGLLYFAQGNTNEAIKHLNIAIRNVPNNPEYYYNLALIQFKLAQLDEAEKTLYKAIKYNPGMFQAYFHMGLLKAAKKKYDESENYFLKTLRLRPDFLRAQKELEKVNEIKSQKECTGN
jgi:Flp pilus assembly protein TadD